MQSQILLKLSQEVVDKLTMQKFEDEWLKEQKKQLDQVNVSCIKTFEDIPEKGQYREYGDWSIQT